MRTKRKEARNRRHRFCFSPMEISTAFWNASYSKENSTHLVNGKGRKVVETYITTHYSTMQKDTITTFVSVVNPFFGNDFGFIECHWTQNKFMFRLIHSMEKQCIYILNLIFHMAKAVGLQHYAVRKSDGYYTLMRRQPNGENSPVYELTIDEWFTVKID